METYIVNVADIVDPHDPAKRTFRQINAALAHSIPLGALVELETGERLRVMMLTRDCDQTPMYCLGITGDDRYKWHNGYVEEDFKVVG
jgi:hypothetical protein